MNDREELLNYRERLTKNAAEFDGIVTEILERIAKLEVMLTEREGMVLISSALIERLREWDRRYPSGTLYNKGEFNQIEKEHDEIVNELLAAATKPDESPETKT